MNDEQGEIKDELSEAAKVVGDDYRSGFVALVGRPNAGKSTLLNRLTGVKVAAVSNKPQTTRHQIRGIVTLPEAQIVFVDTPGVHKPGYLLNRRMMTMVHDALAGVDVLLLMRDAATPTGNGDRFVLDLVRDSGKPAILILNKTDRLENQNELLPLIDWYRGEHEWQAVVPLSARSGSNVDVMIGEIIKNLPVGEPLFDEDELTDQSLRVLVAEMVREKVLETTGEELPYVTAVVTEKYDESDPTIVRINCQVIVERQSQKKIVVGQGGSRIKEIGTRARKDIEALLEQRVYLELFVKVEADWRNSERALNEMGIEERRDGNTSRRVKAKS